MYYELTDNMSKKNNNMSAVELEELLSYSDLKLSPENDLILKDLKKNAPNIKKELINEVKNNMMNQMYKQWYNEDYTRWVIDTLKYFNRYL